MIKHNGYYLEEPTKIVNGRSQNNKVSYSFNAYFFDKEGTLRIRTKHDYIDLLDNFQPKDFDKSLSVNKEYSQVTNQLILKGTNPYQKDIIIQVINENKLHNTFADRNLTFVSWQSIENDKTNALIDLLNSLDESKLKVYYE